MISTWREVWGSVTMAAVARVPQVRGPLLSRSFLEHLSWLLSCPFICHLSLPIAKGPHCPTANFSSAHNKAYQYRTRSKSCSLVVVAAAAAVVALSNAISQRKWCAVRAPLSALKAYTSISFKINFLVIFGFLRCFLEMKIGEESVL